VRAVLKRYFGELRLSLAQCRLQVLQEAAGACELCVARERTLTHRCSE
jgi:hypothetical protein